MRIRFRCEKAEDQRVDESSIHPSGLSQHALGTKPDPHSDGTHCRVVSECVELEPMQSTRCEPVSTQNAHYFGAESSTAKRGSQRDPHVCRTRMRVDAPEQCFAYELISCDFGD
jgi:hypothetical protein